MQGMRWYFYPDTHFDDYMDTMEGEEASLWSTVSRERRGLGTGTGAQGIPGTRFEKQYLQKQGVG